MNWNKIHIKLLFQIHVSFLSVKYQSMLKIRGECRIGGEVEHTEEFLGNYKHNDKKKGITLSISCTIYFRIYIT